MKPSAGWEQAKRVVDLVSGLSVIATMVFIALQWNEMHAGGADTHDLAISAGKQADAAKAQSEQAKAQTEKMTESLKKTDELIAKATQQAAATNRLAQQAKRQADTAANTLEAEERPWIGLDHINPPAKIAVDTAPSSSLIYRNWGRGVAIHVMNEYQVAPFCGTFPIRPTYDVTTSPTPTLQMPGQSLETGSTNFKAPLTGDTLSAIKQPGCGLYVFGRITYRDKGGHEHWRHLCGVWDQRTDNTFQTCGFYNDGDEDYRDGKEP
jgi:hypothetical protein